MAWVAVFGTRMITDFNRVERRHGGTQFRMHGFDRFGALSATPDVRLIRNHNQHKPGFLQSPATVRGVRINLEFVGVRGRVGAAVADHWPIKDAVSIQEDATVYRGDQGHAIKDRNSERSRNESGGPAVLRHSLGDAFSVTYSGATVRHGSVGFNKAAEIDRDDQQSGERDWLKIAHSVASKYGRNEERDSYV